MRARLVRIGNSRGVRIPKPLLDEAGLTDEVEIHLHDGVLTISAVREPRVGWAAAFAEMAAEGDDALLDEPEATEFDQDEWRW